MYELIKIALLGVLIGGIAGGLGALAVTFLLPRRHCANCGLTLPRLRKPANKQEMLHGGWHCPGCAARIDRKGQLLTD